MGKSTGNGIACDWCGESGAVVLRKTDTICDECAEQALCDCGEPVQPGHADDGQCYDCDRAQLARMGDYEPASWAAADAWYDARKDDAAEWGVR